MASFTSQILTFNRGLISLLALARIDIKRTALSAEIFKNWMPRTLGAMMLRPGLKYITGTYLNAKPRYFPFVFSANQTAILELTNGKLRIIEDDAVVTRPSVATVIVDPTFPLAGAWVLNDEAGALSETNTDLELTGTGYNKASRTQTITVAAGDAGKEHAIKVVMARGKASIRVGSASGGEEYVSETEMSAGEYSFAFNPTAGSVYIEIFSAHSFYSLVTSCTMESAGVLVLNTPWTEADLPNIRMKQSGDVLFCVCDGVKPKRIERRGLRSWAITNYESDRPPLRPINLTKTTIQANINHVGADPASHSITASKPMFTSAHADSVFKLYIPKQRYAAILGGVNQWVKEIEVSGVGAAERTFDYVIEAGGTAIGTIRLERSTDRQTWKKVETRSAAIAGTFTIADALDNQIVYYRVGFGPADYTSGYVKIRFDYENGISELMFQATGYTSTTVLPGRFIGAEISVGASSNVGKTTDWEEALWSGYRGYPSGVAIYQSRLWLVGQDRIVGSESDDYMSFDDTVQGDSGPINRTIGNGPVDAIKWVASSATLIVGSEGAEYSIHSSTGGPITPTDFVIELVSTQGSKGVEGDLLDNSVVFVQRAGSRIYEIAQRESYAGVTINDLTVVIPEIGLPGVSAIAIQRQPDTRVHCVRSDGTVAILVHDRGEDVRCWVNFETDGLVMDAISMTPEIDAGESAVYYSVYRNSAYCLEKWALEANCQGGQSNHQADSHVIYSSPGSATLSGLSHLNGKTVVIWADGADLGTSVVSGGSITLAAIPIEAVVGLPYTATWKSVKLALVSEKGTPLNQTKIVDHIGLVLYNTHYKGLQYGRDFDNLDDMPDMRGWGDVAANTIFDVYDESSFEFSGAWNTDSRVCLQAAAPRPCTVLALTMNISQHEK